MSKAELSVPQHETQMPHEACGITAIFSKKGEIVSPFIIDMQKKLQHRGRDSAGISVFNNGRINAYVGLGKVPEVFPEDFNFQEYNLLSDRAIGHNRYGTSGEENKDDISGSQPVTVRRNEREITIAYNGNLPNSERKKLRKGIPQDMFEESSFDTLDIANSIVCAEGETWEERIKNGLEGVKGAYSLTILTDEGEVFGLRGPSGTWPLWIGETKDGLIIFASETIVRDCLGVKWSEVRKGELVKATPNGVERKIVFPSLKMSRCVLHDSYGAHPNSSIREGLTYELFRRELGRELAREHPIHADLTIGVPKTGNPIAESFAEALGKKARNLINANGDRSFIARTVEETLVIVDGKYSIDHPEEIKGKTVMLIDDSLIRGKTMGGDPEKGMRGVIGLVRSAGAREVHLGTILPKFVRGCDMGYYIRKDQLVALVRKEDGSYEELDKDAVAQQIGADSIHFLSIKGLKNVYEKFLGEREVACTNCLGEAHPFEDDVLVTTANH